MGLEHASRFHAVSRLAVLLLSMGGALSSFYCFNRPLEPVAPTWDSNLSLPLLHRTYTLSDLVQKDTSLLHVGPGGQIVYATSSQVRPTYIGNLITVALRDTQLRAKFGAFAVRFTPIDLPILFPWLPQGVSVPIPDTTVNASTLQDTIGSFQSATFKSGDLVLTLQNNLPVPMDVPNPIILDDSHGSPVASFVFPDTISPHSSRTASCDLAGRTIDNIVSIRARLHTTGSLIPVTVPQGTLFSAHLAAANLKAQQAVFASIPPQRLSDNDTTRVTVDDSTLIRELHIASGELGLSFVNHVSLDILLRYRLFELLRWNGASYVPFEDSIFLPARTGGAQLDTIHAVVNLANAKIASQGQELLRSMHLVSSIVLPTGSTDPVTLSESDSVLVRVVHTSTIVADSAIAVLKPTWVSLNKVVPMRLGDLSRFSGQFNIPEASLALETISTFGFPMDLNLRIGARRAFSGDSVFLGVPVSQKRVQTGSDVVVFDPADVGGFLSQFSSGFPREFRIEGRVLVNPPDVYDPSLAGVGSVGSHSSLSGSADMEVPLMMGIVSGSYSDTLALGDTTADGHKDYTIDKKEINNVSSASMAIEVKNAMPVKVSVAFHLLDIGRQSLLRVPQSGPDFTVNAAGVDGAGNVILPASSTVSFQLTESEVRQFNPAEYLTVTISLLTTPGAPAVRFRTTDSVEVRSWSSLRYRINP